MTVNRVLRRGHFNDPYSNYFALRSLMRSGIVSRLCLAGSGREFLARRGIRADYVPLGYAPELGDDLGMERKVDLLYLGTLASHRVRRQLARLKASGLEVEIVGGWKLGNGLWGEERTALLNRAKIFLNLHQVPKVTNGLRMLLGMANGPLVVSEPFANPAPFVPGEHFVSVAARHLPQTVQRLLAAPDERERLARAGHRFVKQEMPMAATVDGLVRLIEADTG